VKHCAREITVKTKQNSRQEKVIVEKNPYGLGLQDSAREPKNQ
jgi:hypothetical protein